jgi:hypothetical protein
MLLVRIQRSRTAGKQQHRTEYQPGLQAQLVGSQGVSEKGGERNQQAQR